MRCYSWLRCRDGGGLNKARSKEDSLADSYESFQDTGNQRGGFPFFVPDVIGAEPRGARRRVGLYGTVHYYNGLFTRSANFRDFRKWDSMRENLRTLAYY